MAVLAFSINAELLATTATPDRSAPVGSFTDPAIAAWANAAVGKAVI